MNYYTVLEFEGSLESLAQLTVEEIRKKYKKLALAWHPDRFPLGKYTIEQRTEAAEKFKHITTAHEELSDPVKRAAHNKQLAEEKFKNRQAEDNNGFLSKLIKAETVLNLADAELLYQLRIDVNFLKQLNTSPAAKTNILNAVLKDPRFADKLLSSRYAMATLFREKNLHLFGGNNIAILNDNQIIDVLIQHQQSPGFLAKHLSAGNAMYFTLEALAKSDLKAFLKILRTPLLAEHLGKIKVSAITHEHLTRITKAYIDSVTIKNGKVMQNRRAELFTPDRVALIEIASKQDNAEAQYLLSRFTPDAGKRAELVQRAAQQGHLCARIDMARYTAEGRNGIEKNVQQAIREYTQLLQELKYPKDASLKNLILQLMQAHPEINAIKNADKKAKNTELFLTDKCPITVEAFLDLIMEKQAGKFQAITFTDLNKNFALTPTGRIYDKTALLQWLADNKIDPLTKQPLTENELIIFDNNNIDLVQINNKLKSVMAATSKVVDHSMPNHANRDKIANNIQFVKEALQSKKEKALSFIDYEKMEKLSPVQLARICYIQRNNKEFTNAINDETGKIKGLIYRAILQEAKAAKMLFSTKAYSFTDEQIINVLINHSNKRDFLKNLSPVLGIGGFKFKLEHLAQTELANFEKIVNNALLFKKLGGKTAIKIAREFAKKDLSKFSEYLLQSTGELRSILTNVLETTVKENTRNTTSASPTTQKAKENASNLNENNRAGFRNKR